MRRCLTARRRPLRIAVGLVATCLLVAGAMLGLAHAAILASDVEMVEVEVGAGAIARSARTSSSTVRLPIRADLLGASWTGTADAIELRARTRGGVWSRWVELHAGDDGPDPRSAEARAAQRATGSRRVASSPAWVGAADEVQVRGPDGARATRIRVWALNATGTATRRERVATRLRSDAAWVLGEQTAAAQPLAPGIRSRSAWKAAKPATAPWYADDVRGVVIHHTAETNRYACSQVPAILRGIQRYHMRANGWNDIGYNFLVDRCGGVWEGRGGGVREPVGGAHTAGFNTSTSGIALMGLHSGTAPTRAAQESLRRLVAWRLDVAHVKPTGQMVLTAGSSDKFKTGSRVVVRAVSGHRDLFPTSCPGTMEYRLLTKLARDAWATGGAKVANITSTFAIRAPDDPYDGSVASVSVRAVASHADMRVTLRLERISSGEVLHSFDSTGTLAQTIWTAPADINVPAWDIQLAVNGVRPSGERARAALVPILRAAPDPAFVVTTPPPSTLEVGGDPNDDYVRLQYTLGRAYRLGAWLFDPATGTQVSALRNPASVGPTATPVELAVAIPPEVPSGSYELRVGLPADPATGRSIRRYPLAITRS